MRKQILSKGKPLVQRPPATGTLTCLIPHPTPLLEEDEDPGGREPWAVNFLPPGEALASAPPAPLPWQPLGTVRMTTSGGPAHINPCAAEEAQSS